jgi:hypothetical protein
MLTVIRSLGACGRIVDKLLAMHSEPGDAQSLTVAADKPAAPEQTSAKRQTKPEAVRQYIAHAYPEGIPAGVTYKAIAKATGTSERSVQRARQTKKPQTSEK